MRPRDAALPTCRCLGPGASWKRGITKKKHQHMRGMPRSHSRGGARPARAHRPVHRSRWNRLSSVCASRGALCQQLGSQQVLWLNPNSHRAAPRPSPGVVSWLRSSLGTSWKVTDRIGLQTYKHIAMKSKTSSQKSKCGNRALGHPVSPQMDLVLRHSQNALKGKELGNI